MRVRDVVVFQSGDSRPPELSDEPKDLFTIPVFGGNGLMGYATQSCRDGQQIIIGRVGEYCGSVHRYIGPCWITDNALCIREWKIDSNVAFIAHVLSHAQLNRHRNKGGQPLITQAIVAGIPLALPPRAEQDAIAELLDELDHAISTLTSLLNAKDRFRQGLRQGLLTGRVRFHQFCKRAWRSARLREITRESHDTNAGSVGVSRVMGVSKFDGIVPMRDRTIGSRLERYKVVRPGFFAYNPMRINIGSIAQWTGNEEVLVSPDYVVFEAIEGQLNERFLDHYRRSQAWKRYMEVTGNGGVRVRIYYDDLAALSLKLPQIDEQRGIAEVLDLIDREIALLRRQRSLFERQKRVVTDKLLTGKIRLTIEN